MRTRAAGGSFLVARRAQRGDQAPDKRHHTKPNRSRGVPDVQTPRRAICRTSSRQGMVMIRDGGSSANTRRPSSIARRGETESLSTMPREIASVVKKTGDRPWRSRPRSTARAFGFPVRCDTSTVMLSAIGTSRRTYGHTSSGEVRKMLRQANGTCCALWDAPASCRVTVLKVYHASNGFDEVPAKRNNPATSALLSAKSVSRLKVLHG